MVEALGKTYIIPQYNHTEEVNDGMGGMATVEKNQLAMDLLLTQCHCLWPQCPLATCIHGNNEPRKIHT